MLIGIIVDLVIGSNSGGNLSELPQTASDRFAQFQKNWVIGLYNLDLLNIVNEIILIPTYFALFAVHRRIKPAYASFALIIFLVGTIIFVSNNTALPMLELSNKYSATSIESQRVLFEAAGEALLARGSHGSLGVLIGFLLPNIAGIMISLVMLRGNIFNKTTSYLGIIGSIWVSIYIVLVTFIPSIKNMATVVVAPGGLLLMAWMIMFTVKLFQLSRAKDN